MGGMFFVRTVDEESRRKPYPYSNTNKSTILYFVMYVHYGDSKVHLTPTISRNCGMHDVFREFDPCINVHPVQYVTNDGHFVMNVTLLRKNDRSRRTNWEKRVQLSDAI